MAKEVAIKKRAQMDKATQVMLISVGAAAVVLGAAIVLSIYFVKVIIFNTKIITEKDTVIKNYVSIQENITKLGENINSLASNEYLEAVARVRDTMCETQKKNEEENEEAEEEMSLGVARICSAIRVIPDALPSTQNDEAVLASLNKLFLETKDDAGNPIEPEAIAPGNSHVSVSTLDEGLRTVPVSLSIEKTSSITRAVLDTIERSIRVYDIQTVNIAWQAGAADDGSDMIELRGNAVAYFSDSIAAELKSKIIYADEENAKGAKKK